MISSVLISMIAVSFCSCKVTSEIKSKWLDREIKIDGVGSEWIDCILYYSKETRCLVGIYNDDKNLYIKISTRGRDLQRMFSRSGFSVWFNGSGKKIKLSA